MNNFRVVNNHKFHEYGSIELDEIDIKQESSFNKNILDALQLSRNVEVSFGEIYYSSSMRSLNMAVTVYSTDDVDEDKPIAFRIAAHSHSEGNDYEKIKVLLLQFRKMFSGNSIDIIYDMVNEMQDSIDILYREFKKFREMNESLKNDNEYLYSQVDEYDSDVEKLTEEKEELESEKQKLEEEKEDLEIMNSDLEHEKSELEEEVYSKNVEIEEIEERVEDLRDDVLMIYQQLTEGREKSIDDCLTELESVLRLPVIFR